MNSIASLVISIAAGIVCVAVTHPAAAANDRIKILSAHAEAYGRYLVDSKGMALYVFSEDRRGESSSAPVSNCKGTCLHVWNLVETTGAPEPGSDVEIGRAGILCSNGDSLQPSMAGPSTATSSISCRATSRGRVSAILEANGG